MPFRPALSVSSPGELFRLTPVRHSPIPPFFVGATKCRGGGRRQWRNSPCCRRNRMGVAQASGRAVRPIGRCDRRPRTIGTPLDDTFDLIIAEQVFEHLLWPYRAARNVHRMLRPGGSFLITTPFLVKIHPVPNDCSRWTETGMKHLLAEAGGRFTNAGAIRSRTSRTTLSSGPSRANDVGSSRLGLTRRGLECTVAAGRPTHG